MSEETQFRTAVFGGFIKQDVMTYLERNAKEHTEKLSLLLRELEEEKNAGTTVNKQYADLRQRAEDLERKYQQLTEELARKEELIQSLTSEKAELEHYLTKLQIQIDKMRPSAIAYESFKERTAGMELEAHGRARQIEQDGKVKAQKVREDTQIWFNQVRDAYQQIHQTVKQELNRLALELKRTGESVDALAGGLEISDQPLDQVWKQIDSFDGPKMPDPLAIQED